MVILGEPCSLLEDGVSKCTDALDLSHQMLLIKVLSVVDEVIRSPWLGLQRREVAFSQARARSALEAGAIVRQRKLLLSAGGNSQRLLLPRLQRRTLVELIENLNMIGCLLVLIEAGRVVIRGLNRILETASDLVSR
eukprot:CAMPEP_0170505504 /NCGR_PEP_ID=MMETSP0208-20121228/51159_1 /TAXON_ID=197538 /ORGANISM="Strombidium inclinatum, Strain S3" /LENGTH=136 /DNA_ID=CAMNT_0010786419 /DNA_START=136 /DNA_END=542 /DNA_ORIENTATION=-